jgi:hypothetical protein
LRGLGHFDSRMKKPRIGGASWVQLERDAR